MRTKLVYLYNNWRIIGRMYLNDLTSYAGWNLNIPGRIILMNVGQVVDKIPEKEQLRLLIFSSFSTNLYSSIRSYIYPFFPKFFLSQYELILYVKYMFSKGMSL